MKWYIGLLLIILPLLSNAKELYRQDFEFLNTEKWKDNLYLFPYPENFDRDKMYYSGNCYRTTAGANFNNWTLTEYKPFSGKRSWHIKNIMRYTSDDSKTCPYPWLIKEHKSRQEIGIGWSQSGQGDPPWGSIGFDQPGYWYAYATRIRSNQPGIDTWIKQSKPRAIITQFIAGGNSATPENHLMLGGDYVIDVEISNSTNPNKEDLKKTEYSFKIEPNDWQVIVIWKKRRSSDDGEFRVYLNCHKAPTPDCSPVVDHEGGNAIQDKPYYNFKLGNYRSDGDSNVDQEIDFDLITVHDASSSLDDVLSAYRDDGDLARPKPTRPEPPTLLNGR